LIVLDPKPDPDTTLRGNRIAGDIAFYTDDLIEHSTLLSQVRGDLTASRRILVDGRTISIKASLSTALQYMRDVTKSLKVWVNGLCISAVDAAERAPQVMLIGKLYSAATRTIILLDKATKEARALPKILGGDDHICSTCFCGYSTGYSFKQILKVNSVRARDSCVKQ